MVGQELGRSAAERAAAGNWDANLRALRGRQPNLADGVEPITRDVEWVFGRDGALTAREAGAWWGGCSLPRRTAGVLLKRMELGAAVTCFLSPTHAAQLRETLDRMEGGKALIAVVPDVRDLRVMLGCEALGEEIAAGRLWFACGGDWAGELERLLRENDGLPTPGQFVRTGLSDEASLQEMIRSAQEVFGREATRRGDVVRTLFATVPPSPDGVCVVAPGRFRLWEDAGGVLGAIARREGWRVLDPDDPCQGSPVAFARAAAGCGAVVMSNVGRSDLGADFPTETRVLTWVTGPRIPRFDPRGNHDALLLADGRWRAAAGAAGWRADRVSVAGWPVERRAAGGTGLGVIADTVAIEMPEFDLSSHKILWETIARELSGDPFAAGDDAGAYLSRWLKRAGIAEEMADARLFVERLIVPAYQQGLVRWLIEEGLDVTLFGAGWDGIDAFAARHAGAVTDRVGLSAAADACAALVHVWPAAGAHPIEAMGLPVLRRGFKGREMWMNEARRLARGAGRGDAEPGPGMSAEVLRRVIRPAHSK